MWNILHIITDNSWKCPLSIWKIVSKAKTKFLNKNYFSLTTLFFKIRFYVQNTKKNTITAFHFLKMFFSSWIVQLLGVLGGIAVIVVFVIRVYFCYNKCSLNPTPGIVVTVTGNDTRTIVTSGMWKKCERNIPRKRGASANVWWTPPGIVVKKSI